MNIIKRKIYQLFCDHSSQKLIASLTFNDINRLYNGKNKFKVKWKCTRCGKVINKCYRESLCSTFPWEFDKPN